MSYNSIRIVEEYRCGDEVMWLMAKAKSIDIVDGYFEMDGLGFTIRKLVAIGRHVYAVASGVCNIEDLRIVGDNNPAYESLAAFVASRESWKVPVPRRLWRNFA